MKTRITFLFIVVLVASIGCKKRLDGFLFNNEDSITEYQLDDYKGELSLDLPSGYFIPENQIFEFDYDIQMPDEKLNVAAIYVGDTAAIKADTVILYCHGNKDHMDHYWPRQKLLSYIGHQGRFGVLMFDYQGYGLSEGTPTEENMYEATNGALKWLKSKGLTDTRLIIYGYSLGSAPASKAVGDQSFVLNPNKIILESPFASSQVMVQDAALLDMPSSYFVNVKINNVEQMKKCTAPLFWMHGEDDDFLDMETHGDLVYKNHTKSWKQKLIVPGADHTNVPVFIGIEEYKLKILEFLEN